MDRSSVQRGLSVYASVSCFERTQIETYRSSLSKAIRELVMLSHKRNIESSQQQSEQHAYTAYDSDTIKQCLAPGIQHSCSIPWTGLMLHHDKFIEKQLKKRNGNAAPITNSRKGADTTPLEELVRLLVYNPSVMPCVCTREVFMVLYSVLVYVSIPRPSQPVKRSVPRAKWRASQFQILDVMEHLLSTRPSCVSVVGPALVKHVRSHMLSYWQGRHGRERGVHEMDCEPVHRMASVLKHLAKTCQNRFMGASILECLFNAVQIVDRIDVLLLQGQKPGPPLATVKDVICIKCQKDSRCLKLSEKSLSSLHDGINESRDATFGIVLTTIQTVDGGTIDRISRKREDKTTSVLSSSSIRNVLKGLPPQNSSGMKSCHCSKCHHPLPKQETITNRSSEHTRLSLKEVFLRTRLYRKAVSVFTMLTMSCSKRSNRERMPLSPTAAFRELRFAKSDLWLLEYAVHKFLCGLVHKDAKIESSSSLRLCLVLFADAVGADGYDLLLESVWAYFLKHSESDGSDDVAKAELFLRVYSEVIVECSVFDNPAACWKAAQPLVNHVLRTKCFSDHFDKEGKQPCRFVVENQGHVRPMLRCISYVLRRRRRVLSMIEQQHGERDSHKFKEFISQLSLLYGQLDMWILPEMNEDEKGEIIQTLQSLGILSFFEAVTGKEEATKESTVSSAIEPRANVVVKTLKSCLHWPFSELCNVRSAHRRMGPHLGRRDLFSSLKRLDHEEKNRTRERRDKRSSYASVGHSDERIAAIPILDYLDDDVLYHVFSFLGYKRLLRVSGVCKEWHSLSNKTVLWRSVYESRFGLLNDDVKALDRSGTNWKTVFAYKSIVERDLRFRHNSVGWKHRTCQYVGCLRILRSESEKKRHYRFHRTKGKQDKEKSTKAIQKTKPKKRVRETKQSKVSNTKRRRGKKVMKSSVDSSVGVDVVTAKPLDETTLSLEDSAFLRYLMEHYDECPEGHPERYLPTEQEGVPMHQNEDARRPDNTAEEMTSEDEAFFGRTS